MRKNTCVVWHGHHCASLPLEILDGSFEQRMRTIDNIKSQEEYPDQIQRRKSLFKKVKGGIKALPSDVQKCYTRYRKRQIDLRSMRTSLFQHYDFIMKLHAKQCGCQWGTKAGLTNIFRFPPAVTCRIYW